MRAASPDGEYFATAWSCDIIKLYRVATGEIVKRYYSYGEDIVWSPNGKYFATTSGFSVKIWEVPDITD